MEPLFTIITVTFNAAGVIKPTLESVAAQDCDDFELLVIDGASTDDTVALVNAAAIDGTRVLSEKDRGLYDAMNKGIRLARGRYLIFLNAGDAFAAPDVLSRLQKAASDEPGVLYGQTVLVDDARQVVGKRHLTAPDVFTADEAGRSAPAEQRVAELRSLLEDVQVGALPNEKAALLAAAEKKKTAGS